MDRLAQVARLIRNRQQGPTEAEIVAACKAGYITGKEANRALEDMARVEDWQAWERETPSGLLLDDEPGDPAAESDVLRLEARSALLSVINDLPPRQRQCVELYYFDGMTQEDIAARIGIDRTTVTRHLEAARDNLATSLTTCDYTFSPRNRRIESEGTFTHLLMAASWRKLKAHKQCLWPYEMWARYCVGTRQAANGTWVTVTENRLRQYLRDTFGDDQAVPPWRY